jgi:hypothetical protein
MELSTTDNLQNIHNRSIEVATYSRDSEHVLVVGALRERREVGFINGFEEQVEPGIYHHMKIELLIETKSMTIKDISVSLPQVPRGECPSIVGSLNGIKGMRITRGFSRLIKEMAGGKKGCVHLNTLLLAMAPAAMQGKWINDSWCKEGGGKPDRETAGSLMDSCWTWRKGGPLAVEVEQRLAGSGK